MTPRVGSHPLFRAPGYLRAARWHGPDERLWLQADYAAADGTRGVVSWRAHAVAGAPQQVCVPNARHAIGDVDLDTLAAHVRMSLLLRGAIPQTVEARAHLLTAEFRLACGTVEVTAVDADRATDDGLVVTFRRKGTTDAATVVLDARNLVSYAYRPAQQLLVVPGAIEAQDTTWEHDAVDDVVTTALTQAQRDAIVAYVTGMRVWV